MYSIKKPKIIWALFDDCNGSWNQLKQDNVISIGINDNPDWDNYYKIDLSIQNPNLIKELSKLPKPDIIIAHPPCEGWSIADNQQRCFRKITKENKEYQVNFFSREWYENHNLTAPKSLVRNFHKQLKTTLDSLSTAFGTIEIIEHFRPDVWIIENPQSSSIWKLIDNELVGVKNKTYYNNYDKTFPAKPTIFYSNINLELSYKKLGNSIPWEKVSGYKRRSSVPRDLLIHLWLELC